MMSSGSSVPTEIRIKLSVIPNAFFSSFGIEADDIKALKYQKNQANHTCFKMFSKTDTYAIFILDFMFPKLPAVTINFNLVKNSFDFRKSASRR